MSEPINLLSLLPDTKKPLPREFYLRNTITVSKDLLGKVIIRKTGNRILAAKIVEVEAYLGNSDPASHAYHKITERNKAMYGIGGHAYVYFIYGNYYCFNVVCEEEGIGHAALIRAVEPVEGIEIMKTFRSKTKNIHDLTNGPAKLCLAMNIDKKLYGADLTKKGEIYITDMFSNSPEEILASKRIGINVAVDLPYRFFLKDNPFVTRHKFNKEIII